MAQGIIPITSLPGWPTFPDGLATKLANVTPCFVSPEGLHVGDIDAAQAFLASFVGSDTQLAHNKDVWLGNLSATYLGKFAAGFNYTGPDKILRTFQIDPTSQFNIDVQANASLGAIMAEVALVTQSGSLTGEIWDANSYFIAADNSHMPTPTPQDMRTFALAVHGYVSGLILWNRALKDQINAAADMKTLSTIDVTAGWPVNS